VLAPTHAPWPKQKPDVGEKLRHRAEFVDLPQRRYDMGIGETGELQSAATPLTLQRPDEKREGSRSYTLSAYW